MPRHQTAENRQTKRARRTSLQTISQIGILAALALALWGHSHHDAALAYFQQKSQPAVQAASKVQTRPEQAFVGVQMQKQLPELYNGCEVTSLSMLLSHAGNPVSKVALALQVRKDPTQEVQDASGNTIRWGDPNQGFVGDITGNRRGYGVYHGPLAALLEQHLPGRVRDLTGTDFDAVLDTLAAGKPLVVWATVTYKPPTDWVTWDSPSGTVRATFSEHCVLLVGYDSQSVMIIDPLDGKTKKLDRLTFEKSWTQMGRQAITYQ